MCLCALCNVSADPGAKLPVYLSKCVDCSHFGVPPSLFTTPNPPPHPFLTLEHALHLIIVQVHRPVPPATSRRHVPEIGHGLLWKHILELCTCVVCVFAILCPVH